MKKQKMAKMLFNKKTSTNAEMMVSDAAVAAKLRNGNLEAGVNILRLGYSRVSTS